MLIQNPVRNYKVDKHTMILQEKIIKVFWRALCERTRTSWKEYQQVNIIIQNDVYVNDYLTGEESTNIAMKRADEIKLFINRGS